MKQTDATSIVAEALASAGRALIAAAEALSTERSEVNLNPVMTLAEVLASTEEPRPILHLTNPSTGRVDVIEPGPDTEPAFEPARMWYFTFGTDHLDGHGLGKFVKWWGTRSRTRELMNRCFGADWAKQYSPTDFARVRQLTPGMREVSNDRQVGTQQACTLDEEDSRHVQRQTYVHTRSATAPPPPDEVLALKDDEGDVWNRVQCTTPGEYLWAYKELRWSWHKLARRFNSLTDVTHEVDASS